MSKITKSQVDLYQGVDAKGRKFGYVSGDDGGFFFTWHPTIEATIASVEEDEQDGDGGLKEKSVKTFLKKYLQTTSHGIKLGW